MSIFFFCCLRLFSILNVVNIDLSLCINDENLLHNNCCWVFFVKFLNCFEFWNILVDELADGAKLKFVCCCWIQFFVVVVFKLNGYEAISEVSNLA